MSVVIIESRFYNHIADLLLEGASKVLMNNNIQYNIIEVPGILEIPTALSMVLHNEQTNDRHSSPEASSISGYIVLGCAIKGETDHYDHVCHQAMTGLRELSQRYHLPLGNGLLTVRQESQALQRARVSEKDFGGQAAKACLKMIEIKKSLKVFSS
jgi:6,7-dimethyl-8-ribityllumazine synthase